MRITKGKRKKVLTYWSSYYPKPNKKAVEMKRNVHSLARQNKWEKKVKYRPKRPCCNVFIRHCRCMHSVMDKQCGRWKKSVVLDLFLVLASSRSFSRLSKSWAIPLSAEPHVWGKAARLQACTIDCLNQLRRALSIFSCIEKRMHLQSELTSAYSIFRFRSCWFRQIILIVVFAGPSHSHTEACL